MRRVVAKRARAGGAALVLVLAAGLWAASSGEPQPRAEALADLEDRAELYGNAAPEQTREFIVPKLDELVDQADR